MGLLYYIPGGVTPADPPHLAKWGLGGAFAHPPTPCAVVAGPDGQAGLVLAEDRLVGRVGYYPDNQTWHDFGALWVGVETDRPAPTPESLQRARIIRGHRVRLTDQQQWEIPVARAMLETPTGLSPAIALPLQCRIDQDGRWVRDAVVADYADLWRIACDWWDSFVPSSRDESAATSTEKTAVVFSFDAILSSASTVLSVNYHLPPQAISALGLFDEVSAREILMAVIDWPTVVAFSKKKVSSRLLQIGAAGAGLIPAWMSLAELAWSQGYRPEEGN